MTAPFVVQRAADSLPHMDRETVASPGKRTFLLERYWPGIDEAVARTVVSGLERAARAMTAEDTPVRHLGSVLMPVDQVVFSLIEAVDDQAARRLNERADLPIDRIATAIALGATDCRKELP